MAWQNIFVSYINVSFLWLLYHSRDCGSTIDPSSLENVEITAEEEAKTMHLKFDKFGRITISKNSKPAIGDGTW